MLVVGGFSSNTAGPDGATQCLSDLAVLANQLLGFNVANSGLPEINSLFS